MLACILRSVPANLSASPQCIHCSITCLIILVSADGSCNAEYMFIKSLHCLGHQVCILLLYMHGYDIHYVVAVCRCTLVFDSDLIVMRNDDINQTIDKGSLHFKGLPIMSVCIKLYKDRSRHGGDQKN